MKEPKEKFESPVKTVAIGPLRSPEDVLRNPPKFNPPQVDFISEVTVTGKRFFLYEPKSKLFVKQDGIHKWWGATGNEQHWVEMTTNPSNAHSFISKEEAEIYLKNQIHKCGYGKLGTERVKDELDDFSGCKVDSSVLRAILNVKWFVVKEVVCSFSW